MHKLHYLTSAALTLDFEGDVMIGQHQLKVSVDPQGMCTSRNSLWRFQDGKKGKSKPSARNEKEANQTKTSPASNTEKGLQQVLILSTSIAWEKKTICQIR
jgi:hypothetical protein